MCVKQKGVQCSFLATDKIILPEWPTQQSTQALSTEHGDLSSLLPPSDLPNAYSLTLWLAVLLPCSTDLVVTLKIWAPCASFLEADIVSLADWQALIPTEHEHFHLAGSAFFHSSLFFCYQSAPFSLFWNSFCPHPVPPRTSLVDSHHIPLHCCLSLFSLLISLSLLISDFECMVQFKASKQAGCADFCP